MGIKEVIGERKGTSERGEDVSSLCGGVMLWRVQQWSGSQLAVANLSAR